MLTDSGSSALKAAAVGLSESVALKALPAIVMIRALSTRLPPSARWAASGYGHASDNATTSEITDAYWLTILHLSEQATMLPRREPDGLRRTTAACPTE